MPRAPFSLPPQQKVAAQFVPAPCIACRSHSPIPDRRTCILSFFFTAAHALLLVSIPDRNLPLPYVIYYLPYIPRINKRESCNKASWKATSNFIELCYASQPASPQLPPPLFCCRASSSYPAVHVSTQPDYTYIQSLYLHLRSHLRCITRPVPFYI